MNKTNEEILDGIEAVKTYDWMRTHLRAALAQPEPCADESDCDYMPWCRIRNACQKQARAALAQHEVLERAERQPLPEPVEESTLLALARRCLWIAYVWNDHNFVEAAHKYAKQEAERHGIKSFEQSNDWLRSHSPQRTPLTEERIWAAYQKQSQFHPAAEPRLASDLVKFARAIEEALGIE